MSWPRWLMGAAVASVATTLCIAFGSASSDSAAGDPNAAARDQIELAAVQFVELYNRHDPAVADLFTDDAEVVSTDAEPLSSRLAIREALAREFAARPQQQLSLAMESLRFVTGDVAIEEGETVTYADGETPSIRSHYIAVHVQRDGRWRMKLVRELTHEHLTAAAALRDLEWLVGDWLDERDGIAVASSCRWDENRNFLLREIEARTADGATLRGQQRIGWDPAAQQIRSWAFDNSGGFSEGTWERDGRQWEVRFTSVRPDGRTAVGTQVIRLVNEDQLEWRTEEVVSGGEPAPPLSVTMIRRPPVPTALPAALPAAPPPAVRARSDGR